MSKLITIKTLPSYNKHFSEDFCVKENDKFIIISEDEKYYKLKSIRTKKIITLSKEYFNEENSAKDKKQIQYD